MQISRGDADIRVARRIVDLRQPPAAGERVANERVPTAVDR